jgi:RNA polymerase sigma-70 factor (ECF subfamily)
MQYSAQYYGYLLREFSCLGKGHRLINERTLVELSRRRNSQAFGELYEKHAVRVYRYAWILVGNRHDAEDITAQTFLRAWQAIERYRWLGRPFSSWVLTIAHNLAVDHVRNNRNGDRPVEMLPAGKTVHNPEAVWQLRVETEGVRDAIMRLKPTQREVVLLRFVDDLGYDEVARILDKTVNAVRVIQYRALCNLRRMVADVQHSSRELRSHTRSGNHRAQ